MNAAVYDISSRKMLFRAPGTSRVHASATLINLSEQLRVDSLNGFKAASDDLVLNLQTQLERFKTKVKEMPQQYVIENKPGYGGGIGGGELGAGLALTLLSLGGIALWVNRRHS
jgi:rhombotail lipoprotein